MFQVDCIKEQVKKVRLITMLSMQSDCEGYQYKNQSTGYVTLTATFGPVIASSLCHAFQSNETHLNITWTNADFSVRTQGAILMKWY